MKSNTIHALSEKKPLAFHFSDCRISPKRPEAHPGSEDRYVDSNERPLHTRAILKDIRLQQSSSVKVFVRRISPV